MKEPEVPLSEIGSFVPFPTALFDEQMPKLKDTEWRLLCVIVRQTLGWQSGKGRKVRDWMSQKQLMARTGRNSAALSAALDSLIRQNLIQCQDVKGNPLHDAKQRRRHRGRLYFSLAKDRLTTFGKQEGADLIKEDASAKASSDLVRRIYSGWEKVDVIARKRVFVDHSKEDI